MERKDLLMVVGVALVVAIVVSVVANGGITGGAIWGRNWCRADKPCPAGEGDCDRNSHCQGELVCSKNVGVEYGQRAGMDVCEYPGGGGGTGSGGTGGGTSTTITYMDPTQCRFLQINETNGDSMGVECGFNEFVGRVTHIDCPSVRDDRRIVGTGWRDNTLPSGLHYSCVDTETGEYKAPSQVFAYCCEIQGKAVSGVGLQAVKKNTATTNNAGRTSLS